ncbi:D-Ala-D-Ala carboxypeptidase family metallohydrolase [Mesorhizobium escarrei]|uniref:Peptidase M15A n=1 Tax=Mesorhizobium escarrei TaxID=666018 RepID=A0ABM9DHL4_9HYPH|nr:D-Ala-D-Ala carboxypeptidase family metallohydrolase [Mesorhizobium escarrei]CAH2396076.1 Peptidase M15A [Mesorhizobium escarrei]
MVLKSAGSRLAKGESRAIAAALFSVLLASCTSAGDPSLSVGMPGYNASATDISTASGTQQVTTDSSSQMTTSQMTMTAKGDTSLPEQVAYVPVAKPGAQAPQGGAKSDAGFPVPAKAGAEMAAGQTPQPQAAQTVEQADAATQKTETADAGTAAQKSKAEAAAPATNNPVYVTAAEPQAYAPKKKGFLASLFSATPASAAPAPQANNRSGEQPPAAQPKLVAKPAITLASAKSAEKPVQLASLGDTSHFTDDALPGVRKTALFEIKRKSGLDDDSDVDLNEDEGGAYQVAYAPGLARLAPNGLLKQTENVDVACLKPSLVRVLKTIEGHYGKKMIVTSGYRDPARNRRANGAKNSLHMYCAAADIQVPGVSKAQLASYIRSMPGRGGVGTYCHTESVHIDVGPERDWNWRCRRRR